MTSSDKSQITVLACTSASGCHVSPSLVFAGQRFSYNPLKRFEDAVIGRSENGWMYSDLFKKWLSDVFVRHLNEKVVRRPVIFLVDGHSKHMTMEVSVMESFYTAYWSMQVIPCSLLICVYFDLLKKIENSYQKIFL